MPPSLRLALFEPDIPQNTAALLRTCGCLGVPCEIIEPCGFILRTKQIRRIGMDYLDKVVLTHHQDWETFQSRYRGDRRILLTTKVTKPYTAYNFRSGDTLVMGRESAGAPDFVHAEVDERLTIPMVSGMRSLNIGVSAAIVMAEALRQLDAFPKLEAEPDA